MGARSIDQSFRAPTPWGDAVLHCSGVDLVGIVPPHRTDDPEIAALPPADAAPSGVAALAVALAGYLAGEPVELAARDQVERWLTRAGVDGFRRDLSLALFDVPRGVTLAYGELAALAGRPGAARAAGTTCARNPLPLLIPCHRVVHAGARRGDVGAYGAATGTAYKRRLLELEGALLVR